MLLNALAALGHRGIKTIRTFGRAGLMLFNALVGKPEFRKTRLYWYGNSITSACCRCSSSLCPVCLSAWCWGCRATLF